MKKTIENVQLIAEDIRLATKAAEKNGDTRMIMIYLLSRAQIAFREGPDAEDAPELTPAEFVSHWLVAEGIAIPETAMLVEDFTCIMFLRNCPIEDQVKHIRNREPFRILRIFEDFETSEFKTFDQLNKEDCKQLFAGDSHKGQAALEADLTSALAEINSRCIGDKPKETEDD